MTIYGEYTTLAKLKGDGTSLGYLDITNTNDDALLLRIIRSTSREIDKMGNRHYYPLIDTRYYNTPQQMSKNDTLMLDDDLLDLTTLTDGDGTVITSAQYKLYPLNSVPNYKIILLKSVFTSYATSSAGDSEGAISVNGVWGYHEDYPNSWADVGATLGTSVNNSTTAFTVTTGKVTAGHLAKIDSEFVYISAVATSTTNDNVTVVRAVNGSIAAAHTSTTSPFYIWQVDDRLEMITEVASAAYYKRRANPSGDTIMIGGMAFATPRDITAYLAQELRTIGALKVSFG